MNSWQNSREPLSISMRWISIPGWWISTMKTLRPRCLGTSQFVRARHRAQSAHQAPVVQIFEPFRTHSSPSRTAVVCAPARSDPPLGSDRNCIQKVSPLRMGGTWRTFCSSVPNSRITAMHGVSVGTCVSAGNS